MRFIEQLLPLRLYSNKRKVFIPVNEKDKKHGAAIFLMGTTQDQNEKMMNAPFLYSRKNMYRAYYVDRNVMTYINSDAINAIEEEFDEVQEAMLSEGMLHTDKAKFRFENASTMDERVLSKIFNKDAMDKAKSMMKMKNTPVEEIIVYVHPSVADLRNSYPRKSYMEKPNIYSYSRGNEIHIISYLSYNEKEMDGPYEIYCRHELFYCLITNYYPTINRNIATYVAMALSGQVEWLREEKDNKEFKYKDSEKEKINGLYIADLIYQLYQTRGAYGIKKLLEGDTSDLSQITGGRIVRDFKKLFRNSLVEANLSASDREKLKDSDFGIPSKKKYPMPDAAHVKAAIRMFNHCDPEDEAELAKNIKSKMKKFDVTAEIGEKNRLSKYIKSTTIKESASIDNTSIEIEYTKSGDMIAGNFDKDYYAVLHILDDFSKEEFDRISFYPTYKNSEWIKKRIVLYDNNDIPMAFMDVYHFPSDPERAQITTAVSKFYRGRHLSYWMFQQLLESKFAEENGIKKYIWHVHPGNIASEKIAKECKFVKPSEDLDKYGRMTYVYKVSEDKETTDITLPSVSLESGVVLNENAVILFEEEVNSKYDSRMKRYLYKERLRNARSVMTIYDQVKQRNPKIDRTYRELKLYKGLNLYVDTSYYHALYLKNAVKGTKRAVYMYLDFLTRLMENEELFKTYKKITYFFPVQFNRPGESVDELLNWSQDLNPLSLIAYLVRKDPEALKRFADKTILFIGDKGYFKVDFNNFVLRNFTRFKKNVTKLLSAGEIIDEDEDDIDDDLFTSEAKGAAVDIITRIEDNTGIEINDISPVSNIKINHLSMETTVPKLTDTKNNNAILILGLDSNSVIADMESKALKSKDIKNYYKPKL